MAFTNLEKTDMVSIYGEARGHSEPARQIYGERFPERILPNARTFVNVVQHLRDFRRFEMNKPPTRRFLHFSRKRRNSVIVHFNYFWNVRVFSG
jgi:hypothetical protein